MKELADELFPELTEQEIEELVTNVPPKDRKLITSAVDFSVSTLIGYMRDKSLVVPEFQRRYVWSEAKASRLIESLIMQCPVPVVYLSRRADGVLEVVDGNQRLNSIRKYLDGGFALKGLTAFPELDGTFYDDLDPRFQRHINAKTIRCVVIEAESHPQIKFDVFERLNSGSTPLNAQELRHGIYSGDFVRLLKKLSSTREFVRSTGIKNDPRMKRDELVLRFFALNHGVESYEKPLSNFLNRFAEVNRNISDVEQQRLSDLFNRVMLRIDLAFGEKPFRFRTADDTTPKFNTAFFDALTVGCSLSEIMNRTEQEVVNLGPRIRAEVDRVQRQPEFRQHVLRATSDEIAVRSRVNIVRDALNTVR